MDVGRFQTGVRALGLLLCAAWLTACVSSGEPLSKGRSTGQVFPYPPPASPADSGPDTRSEPAQRPPVEAGEGSSPAADGSYTPIYPSPPPPPTMQSPAISGLMQQARAQLAAGRPDQAAILLERAQRIEPRNAPVWAMLAQTRLLQSRPDQAEALASKSNSLANGDPYVTLENWKTIASAREQQGNRAGAVQAQAQVEALQRGLYGTTP